MCKSAVCGSSPLLSFMSLQSHSGLAAGAALPRSSLLIPFTAFAEGCLHLCISSSTAHHPREHTVPRAETFLTMHFQHGALLLCWYLQNTDRRNSQHLPAADSDCCWRPFQVPAQPWEIPFTSTRLCPTGLDGSATNLQVHCRNRSSSKFCLSLSSSLQHVMQEKRLHWLFDRCLLHLFYFWKPKGTAPTPRGAHNARHGDPMSLELLFPGVPSPKGSSALLGSHKNWSPCSPLCPFTKACLSD